MYSEIDVSIFPPEREQQLKSIFRYSVFKTMYYRSDLWMHEHRVLWILEALLPEAQKYLTIDPEKARALALVHDDAEMLTGDAQSGHKAQMTKEQLQQLENNEEAAIRTLVAAYPKEVHGYSYEELLLSASRKDSVEAQLVSYADKMDAHGEVVHELMAGNVVFLTAFALYARYFAQFPYKFPALASFLKEAKTPFTGSDIYTPPLFDTDAYEGFFTPHTRESLKKPTEYLPFYDAWRAVVTERGGEEHITFLTTQKEYLAKQ